VSQFLRDPKYYDRLKSMSDAEYARELQTALTDLTCGGSEFFVRHGDGYRADIRACVTYVRSLQSLYHSRTVEAIRAKQAAEATQ
jgi:hypothetical protein